MIEFLPAIVCNKAIHNHTFLKVWAEKLPGILKAILSGKCHLGESLSAGGLLKQNLSHFQFFMFSCLTNRLVLQAGSLTDACLLNTFCSRACWWGKRLLQKNVSSTLALLQLLDSEEHMRLFFPITNFSSLTRNISFIPFQLAFSQWQSINYILILFLRKNSVVLKEASCWNKNTSSYSMT